MIFIVKRKHPILVEKTNLNFDVVSILALPVINYSTAITHHCFNNKKMKADHQKTRKKNCENQNREGHIDEAR